MIKHLDFLLGYVYTRQTCLVMAILFLLCGLAYSISNAYADILHYNNMVFFMCGVIIFLIILLIGVLSFGIIQSSMDKYRNQLKEENYELLQNYVKDLEAEYLQIRGFKHDFANIFVSMYGYMEQEDMTGLKKFYREHLVPLKESMHTDHAKLAVLSRIQSEELKSLLYGKLSHALYCQLHVSVELRQPVILPDWVNQIDLNRVLGIFLDNAIESSLDSEEKTLQVAIVVDSDHLCFLVANSCQPFCCNTEKIFSLNYSTKGSYRGLGLYQAKKLLDKDERYLLTTNLKGTTFLQQLEIYYN